MVEGWSGLAQEHFSRLREAGAARRSRQKRDPQSLFKLLDCLTHGGWRYAEEPGGCRKIPGIGDGLKRKQAIELVEMHYEAMLTSS